MQYICVPEEYEKDGEKKVKFYRIGEAFKSKSGKVYAKLYHIPGKLLHFFEAEKPPVKPEPTRDEFGADNEVPF